MRILVIGSELHPPPTNMESQMLACLKENRLSEKYDIRALSIRINKPPTPTDSFNYVLGLRYGPVILRKPFYGLELIFRLEREIKKGVDIVHFIWVGFPFITQCLIRYLIKKKIKILYSVLSSATPPARYRGAHQLMVSTHETYRRYLDYGFDATRVNLIPPPVDRAKFFPSDTPPRPYFVCASGPFTASHINQRGVPILFKAFAQLWAENIPVELKYFGRWPEGHTLLESIANKYKARNVTIKTGYCEELPEIIRNSMGVILPYIATGDAPLSALEAICCGRPVIITHGPGLGKDIADYGAGYVVSATPASIAAAVKNIMGNPIRFSYSARQMASQYDQKKYIEAHFTIYDTLFFRH